LLAIEFVFAAIWRYYIAFILDLWGIFAKEETQALICEKFFYVFLRLLVCHAAKGVRQSINLTLFNLLLTFDPLLPLVRVDGLRF